MTRNFRLFAVLLCLVGVRTTFAQDAKSPDATPATPAASQPKEALKDAYKDLFKIGVAMTPQQFNERDAVAVAVIKNQFNSIAPENVLKWDSIHPRAGADGYNFAGPDAYVEFGVKNNMHIVGHTLLWHSQTPGWVFTTSAPQPAAVEGATTTPAAEAKQEETKQPEGEAGRRGRGRGRGGRGGPTGPPATRDELLERMREHIHAVVGRYKGKIHAWDVVNEALSENHQNPDEVYRLNSPWYRIIGPDFIAKAFQYAHEADPNAILRYNDFSLENPVKRRKAITLIKQLQAQGVPIHAIGTQAHLPVNNATFERMDETLTELATLGLPIHVTELDINNAQAGQRNSGADISENAAATRGALVSDADKRLTEGYAGIFRAFIKHKEHVKLVTFWGLNDAVSWRREVQPLLFNGQNQPKAAYDAVIAEAKKAN